jgi:hypothetical protein
MKESTSTYPADIWFGTRRASMRLSIPPGQNNVRTGATQAKDTAVPNQSLLCWVARGGDDSCVKESERVRLDLRVEVIHTGT